MMCKHRFVCYFRCLMVKDVSSFSCYACWWIDRQVKEAPKPDVFVEKATDTTGSRKFLPRFRRRRSVDWNPVAVHNVVYPSLSHDFLWFHTASGAGFHCRIYPFTLAPRLEGKTIHSLANHGPWPNHGHPTKRRESIRSVWTQNRGSGGAIGSLFPKVYPKIDRYWL